MESLVGANGLFTLPAAAMPSLGATAGIFVVGPLAGVLAAGLAVEELDTGIFLAVDVALLVPVPVPVPAVDRGRGAFLAGLAVVAGLVATLRGGEVAGVAVPVRLAVEDAVGADKLVLLGTLVTGFAASLALSSALRAFEEAVGAVNRLDVLEDVTAAFGFAAVEVVVPVDFAAAGAVAFDKVEGRETGVDFAFDAVVAGLAAVVATALPLAAVGVADFIVFADLSSGGVDFAG